MKTQEEIKQMANEWALSNADVTMWTNSSLNKGFIKGYTQCQEDMADKKYTEDDLRKAFYYGGKSAIDEYGTFEDFINSLNKQD